MRRAYAELVFLVLIVIVAVLAIGFFVGLTRAYIEGDLGQLDARAVPTAKVKRVVWHPQRRGR